MDNFNFNIDGKALINALLIAKAKEDGRDDISKLIKIFDKYNLSVMDGMALLLEIVTCFDEENGEE